MNTRRNRPLLPFLGLAALCLLPVALLRSADGPGDGEDEKLLQKARVRTDDDGLLQFLRQRTLTDAKRQHLEQQVRDLGSKKFADRQRASRDIIAQGPPALPYLRRALQNPDVEVVNRARHCLDAIQKARAVEVPAAVVRLLVRRRPAHSAEALLGFLPFADNEGLAEEVINGLDQVCQRSRRAHSALAAALHDRLPARRGAAAYVLARAGDPGCRADVRRFLADPDPQVRLQAAHGLLAVHDAGAVPVLIALVREGPAPLAWQAEDLLAQVAGDGAPGVSVSGPDAGARRQAAAAWEDWWRTRGPQVDWDQVEVGLIGGAVVAELETDTVWEAGPGGKPRWEVEDLQGPYDVQPLARGRLLVAEYTGQRVTERDRRGKILWQKSVADPVACRRLPNGNTFIATIRGVLEVRPDGREVYSLTLRKEQQPVYGAYRAAGSDTAYIACEDGLLALDTAQRKTSRVLAGEVADVQGLPNGHLLVAVGSRTAAKVAEVNPAGKTVWEARVPDPSSATRLANGHTLTASKSDRRLAQIDPAGKVVWQRRTVGRPIRVRRR
jgi:hypothetical protein